MNIIKINSVNRNNTNFRRITLSEKETVEATKLISYYATKGLEVSKKELVSLFNTHIEKEAVLKSKGGVYILGDVVQSLWEFFLTNLETVKTLNNPLDELIKIIDKFKPTKEELDSNYNRSEVSLNKKLYRNNDKKTLGDTISSEQALVPVSQPNEEERKIFRGKVEDALIGNLTDREKKIIRSRAAGKTYKTIGEDVGLSISIAHLRTKSAIAKVQYESNTLPQEYTDKAKDLIKVLGLKKDLETMKKGLIKHPEILPKDVNEMKEKITKLSQIFNIEYSVMLECGIKQPPLLYQNPETIIPNVTGVVEEFEKYGLTIEDYIFKACFNFPSLFCQDPKTIISNVTGVIEEFEKYGLTIEDYISKACLKQPQLFGQNPKTIISNVTGVIEEFKQYGLTIEDYISKACLKLPKLFGQDPKTIGEHINAYMYIEKNKNNYKEKDIMEQILKKNLCYSTSLIYLKGIIRPQLRKQDKEIAKWGKYGLKQNLEKYFTKYPDKQFTITLVEDETADKCIKTIQDFCNKTFKRDDMFKFEKVAA